jgi:hypothetical protein
MESKAKVSIERMRGAKYARINVHPRSDTARVESSAGSASRRWLRFRSLRQSRYTSRSGARGRCGRILSPQTSRNFVRDRCDLFRGAVPLRNSTAVAVEMRLVVSSQLTHGETAAQAARFIERFLDGFPGLALTFQGINFPGDHQTPIGIGRSSAASCWSDKPEGLIEGAVFGGEEVPNRLSRPEEIVRVQGFGQIGQLHSSGRNVRVG